MLDDDEPTTFEMNPLGNRQRLKPRNSFLARAAVTPKAPITTVVIDASMIVSAEASETIDEALVSGDHTMSDVVLPSSSAVMLPAMAIATPVPSLLPPAALLILPKEIHYPMHAAPYYPPTESHNALPIASRRVRYLAVPAIALLALVVLGGAMMPPDVESMSAPAANIRATREATSAPRVHEIANEPPAPAEEVVVAKPVARPIAKRVAKPAKITVNTSSALGNLRVRKW